jgi:hypothetical protein
MRLTLDTSCVIDAAQAQPRGPQVDELVDLARHRRVGLWITEAFTVDQETAPADRHQPNLAWLSARPVIGRIPGPWRLGYSGLGPDGFTDDTSAAADLALREIILSERLQRGRLDEHDPALLARTATRSPTSSTSPSTAWPATTPSSPATTTTCSATRSPSAAEPASSSSTPPKPSSSPAAEATRPARSGSSTPSRARPAARTKPPDLEPDRPPRTSRARRGQPGHPARRDQLSIPKRGGKHRGMGD